MFPQTSTSLGSASQRHHRRSSLSRNDSFGFSLVEVTLALGIVAFALIPLMALLPMGLTSQREAIESTATTQILQTITGDLQRTEFAELVDSESLTAVTLPIRSFDGQGNELVEGETNAVGTGARAYDVKITLEYPAPIGAALSYSMVRAEIQVAPNPQGASADDLFAIENAGDYLTNFALVARTSQ